jgi:DNA-binding MarR family transcriptional regulator
MSENDLSSDVLIALRQIMRAVDLHSKRLERNYKLTGPQLIVLSQITKNDNIPIGKLADLVSLSNATVTGIVDRLEKRGLVTRIRSTNDRRQVLIKATDNGIHIFKSAPSPLQEQFLNKFNELNVNDQQAILSALEEVATMMKAEHLEVAPVLSGQPLPDNEQNAK